MGVLRLREPNEGVVILASSDRLWSVASAKSGVAHFESGEWRIIRRQPVVHLASCMARTSSLRPKS